MIIYILHEIYSPEVNAFASLRSPLCFTPFRSGRNDMVLMFRMTLLQLLTFRSMPEMCGKRHPRRPSLRSDGLR